jgi:hypothetical protein
VFLSPDGSREWLNQPCRKIGLPLRPFLVYNMALRMGQQFPEQVQVPLSWVGIDELPVVFVNQMLGQLDDRGDVLLTLGQTTPPALVGDPQEVYAQAQRLAYVPVKPVARVTLSRPRLFELIGVLQQLVEIQAGLRETMRAAGQGENL